jgi:tetratricopeptide (TPR) repeat protein
MTIAKLPDGYLPPTTGWSFHGTWSETDAAHITQALRERVPNRTQALNDHWLFVAARDSYYAHCPTVHAPGYGYREDDAAELADTLWGHYFTLRLGPLVLAAAPPQPVASDSPQPEAERLAPRDVVEPYTLQQQALEHFHTALTYMREGDYAAAKQEMQLSLALYPANHFFHAKRLETCGDIESYLGDDRRAEHSYEESLALVKSYHEQWFHTELRLKLAWCAMRQQRMAQARAHIDAGIMACELGRTEDGGSRSLNALHGLALATMADWHLHQHDSDAALAAARRASTIASRLGQSYGEKARVYLYLAWSLYVAGETEEARGLARRAWTALERWLPIASAQTAMMRETLTTVLGGSPQPTRAATSTALPALDAMIATAFAALGRMESWVDQTKALHALAPLLQYNQLPTSYDDLLVWDREDWAYFAPYRAIIEADLFHTMPRTPAEAARIVNTLVTTDVAHVTMLAHEHLYAEALLRMYHHVAPGEQPVIAQRMQDCAIAWCQQLNTGQRECDTGILTALATLIPSLQSPTQYTLITHIEAYLLAKFKSNRYTDDTFLIALPLLATFGAGQTVVEAIVEAASNSLSLWVACLAHASTSDHTLLREHIVESALNTIKRLTPFGSTTNIAERLGHIAPYLQGEEIHQALAFATQIRAIVPRVRALTALVRMLPAAEQEPILARAWQAANRSNNADTMGTALTIVAVCAGDMQSR